MVEVDDLSLLDDLNVDEVLENIDRRFEVDDIYTRCGDIIIAVNPYKETPLYTKKQHDRYRPGVNINELPPHVFETATKAYTRLCQTETNQVILVSGESGAGKTESTKHIIRHLMHICGSKNPKIHDQIVQVNPLLEAFGNAKTCLNDNSSRYAKYLELLFTHEGQINGASIKDYMLEKSRVVKQGLLESNFHIFHALLYSGEVNVLSKLSLEGPEKYRITKKYKCAQTKAAVYKRLYGLVKTTLKVLKFEDDEVETVHRVLAAILHLSNVQFSDDDYSAYIINEDVVNTVANLLYVDVEDLSKALISTEIATPGGAISTTKGLAAAEDGRDALGKALFERLFGFIVKRVNEALAPQTFRSDGGSIGIIDICGFESVQLNSLEQLCINIVNEKLQGFMNECIFKREKEIYQEEGLPIKDVVFQNNDNIIDMFMKPTYGILDLMDEEARLKHGTNKSMIAKLSANHLPTGIYSVPKSADDCFMISHFAGLVSYDANGFIEKTRDTLSRDLLNCVQKSQSETIGDMFRAQKAPTGTISQSHYKWRKSVKNQPLRYMANKSVNTRELVQTLRATMRKQNIDAHQVKELANKLPKEHKTVVSYFKASLQQMLEKMRTAQPLFVRCIKPNERQKPGDFDSKKVKEQLLYNGIAEIARIRKFGFSTRRTYMEFRGRYGDLCPESKTEKDRTEAARTILKEIFPFTDIKDQNIRFGKNRIFFRDFIFTTLEEKLEELKQKKRNDAAVIIQKNWRGELGRRKARDRKRAEAKRILEKELSGMSFGPVTKKNPIFDPDDDSLNDSPPSMDSPIQESVESSDDDLGRLPSKFSNLKDTLHKSHPSILKKPHVPGSSGDVNRTNGDITSTISSGASGSSTSSAYKTFDNVSGSNSDKTKMSNDSHAKKKVEDIEAKLKEETEEEDRAAFWDIFQIIEREGGSEDVHSQRVMIFLKIFFYILLGLVLLFCCVTQKISLMVLVSSFGLSNMKEEKGTYFLQARYLLTLLAVCIPYAVSFLSNLYKVCFGDFPTPRWSTFIVCFLVETAHTAGLSILTFKILPQLDFLTGIMVLSATASIPSVLKLLCASNSSEKSNCSKKFMWYVCDLIAMCVQLTIIPVMILSDVIWTSTVSFSESRALDILFVILAFLLVSVVHWENFTDNRLFVKLKYRGSLCQSLFQLKYDLQEGRPLVSVVTTMWKIGVTILLAYLLRPSLKDNFDVIKAFDELDNEHEISLYTSVLCLTITPFVAHYVAATACKLRMQKFSFSLPLLLSTPVSVGAALIQCNTYGFINTISTEFSDKLCGNTSDIFFPWWKFLFGACWWLSLHVCVRHIWLPRQERLAKLKRLFISPQYCSILLEEYFVLNRRRDDRIIQREQDDKKFIYHLIKPTSKDPKQSAQTDRGNAAKESDRIVPMVYACGTMWHETRKEMVQLLKSLFRMDKEQFFRRVYEEVTGKQDPDYFDFESHIFFDDCMELNDDEELVPNSFVRQFITCVNVAASSVHKRVMDIGDPVRIITPYGGQLVWEMPGGCLMYVHLKDKVKIKHRKRWSQVMYMYYLLGYRLNRECQDKIEEEIESGAISRHLFEQGEALDMLDRNVKAKADNTFLLALDGDVDFTPGAVRLLIDRMKKNDKVGAACGRIHPIGSGPMVWYQKFEYAVGHWLQKATEHVVGCVLCSPGCFSLFRGSSLMDNNVMKKYTLMPSEAVHYLQYDQGEDRWLCTLLIQQGYKVDYCAASDAWTFAPESFGEFFNQRRRWMPSTLANILDLLSASSDTVAVNSNMSYLYIAYQAMLFYSTLIGPGTIIMMIAGAFATVFELSLLDSYLIAVIPAAFYFALCLKAPSAVQINVAAILSAIYAFIMMIVFVGSIIMALQQSFFHPSVIFMVVLALIFILSAIFHPKEWTCVIPGIMYFLCIPSGYLLLVLYSMCNMYVVSWGTREVPRKKTKRELAEEKRKAEEKKKEKKPGFFSRFFFSNQLEQLKESLQKTNLPGTNKHESEMISLLKEMNANIKALLTKEGGQPVNLSEKLDVKPKKKVGFKETVTPPESEDDEEEEMIVKKVRDEMENPAWSEDPCLGKNTTLIVDLDECSFWEQVIAKYLKPMEKNVVEEKKTTAQLIELRNNACFGMALVNLMWIAINFMFQYKKPTEFSVEYELGEETYEMKIEILGLLFIIFFIAILIIQFYGMLVHRWGTLLHLISITEVRSSGTINAEMQQSSEKEKLLRLCQDVYHVPVPDYDIDGDDADNNVTGADNMTYPPSLPPRPERLPSFSMTLAQSIKQNSQFGHRKSMKRRGSSGAAVSTAEQLKESRKLGDDRYFKDLLRRNLSGEMDSQFAPPDADQMIKRRYTRNENLSRNAAWFGTITKRAMKRVQMSAFEMGGENRNGSLAKSRRRYEEENIYDDIPASRMGRHFAKNVSKLKKSIHGRYAPNDRSAYYEQGGRPQGNMMLYP